MKRRLALVLVLLSCGRTEPLWPRVTVRDAGPRDAGTDAGPRDAGVDAGTPDSGIADAGTDWCASKPCDVNATCTNAPDRALCACNDGFEGDGFTCTSIAANLDGLRWELPCVGPWPQAPNFVCITTPAVTDVTTLSGAAGHNYDVTLRIRGVVETKQYTGGTTVTDGGHWMVGGTPINDDWNVYSLTISNPPQTHFLNNGESGLYECFELDYEMTVRISAGSQVTLVATPVDSRLSQIRNNVMNPIVPAGVPPAPMSFNGQFIQMDVVKVAEAH